METAPPGGKSHMAEVRPSGSGLVCFEHDCALPALVFRVSSVSSGSGHSGPRVAQDQSLCFSSDPAAASGSVQSTVGQRGAFAVGGPVVAHSDMVFRPGQSASRPSLGGSPQTRSVDASSGHDLVSSARFMEVVGMAPEWLRLPTPVFILRLPP